MAISLRPDAPGDGASVIARAVQDLGLFGRSDPMSGGAALDVSKPIAIYRVALNDKGEYGTDFLDAARMVGWRYLLEAEGGKDVSYVDLHATGDHTHFSSIARNPNAVALMDAAHRAEQVAQPLEGDCELRAIEAPAARVAALWLVHATASFIPYIDGSAGAPLRGSPLSEQDFLAAINERVKGAGGAASNGGLVGR